MTNSDLSNIWNQSNTLADDHFHGIKSNLKDKYQKKGLNEIKHIKMLFWLELGLQTLSFLVITGILISRMMNNSVSAFYIICNVVSLIALSYFGYLFFFKYYSKLNSTIDELNNYNIKEALDKYLNLLKEYRIRSTKTSIVLVIISNLIFFIDDYFINSANLFLTLLSCLFGLIFTWGVIYEYYDYMYKPSETEIEILISQLEEE